MEDKEIIGYKVIKPFPNQIRNYNVGYIISHIGHAGMMDLAPKWPEYFEPIYKEKKKLPVIDGVKGIVWRYDTKMLRYGKFDICVNALIHLNDEEFLYPEGNIESITLNSGMKISAEQIKQMIEFFND